MKKVKKLFLPKKTRLADTDLGADLGECIHRSTPRLTQQEVMDYISNRNDDSDELFSTMTHRAEAMVYLFYNKIPETPAESMEMIKMYVKMLKRGGNMKDPTIQYYVLNLMHIVDMRRLNLL